MPVKIRSLLTITSFIALAVFLLLLCVFKTTFYAAMLIWSILFVATLTIYDINHDIGGSLGGYSSNDPDPTGKKTIKGLVISSAIMLISLAYMQFAHLFFVIQRASEYDTKQFFPILVLLMIFGAFGFRR